jgi:hypothetical protein
MYKLTQKVDPREVYMAAWKRRWLSHHANPLRSSRRHTIRDSISECTLTGREEIQLSTDPRLDISH